MKNLKFFLDLQKIIIPEWSHCVFQVAAELTRKKLMNILILFSKLGAKGLAYIKGANLEEENGLQSPILKFLEKETINSVISASELKIMT